MAITWIILSAEKKFVNSPANSIPRPLTREVFLLDDVAGEPVPDAAVQREKEGCKAGEG